MTLKKKTEKQNEKYKHEMCNQNKHAKKKKRCCLPGRSMHKIGMVLGNNGISRSNVPALSCQPCNANTGCLSRSPYHLPATCPHGTGILISSQSRPNDFSPSVFQKKKI